MNATTKTEAAAAAEAIKAADEQSKTAATIRALLAEAFNADAAADKVADKAKADRETATTKLKQAADLYKAQYPTLEDMLKADAEATIKADIGASLPDDMKAARLLRETKQIKTPTQLLQKGVTKAEQAKHMRLTDLANKYAAYQGTYFKRICDYAFPATKTAYTRAQDAIKAAFAAHVKMGKAGLPESIKPEQFSEAKVALVKLGTLYGLQLADKAKA